MDWARLNDKTFEELACAYAKDTYHEYQWVPTGKSWDGNKDALFRNKIDSLNCYYQGWCEAKYTEDPNSSIPKSHMDSTLVSGILDGEVIFILFVTNGKITNSFIQRATSILKPHKIQIKFVDGAILTDWVNANPCIKEHFFLESSSDDISKALKIDIVDHCFLDAVMSSPSLISSITKMRVNCEYFLYLNLYSSQRIRYFLEIDTNVLAVLPDGVYEDSASPGYNSVLIKCLAKSSFNGTVQVSIRTESGYRVAHKCLPIFIEYFDDVQVVYAKQQQYIQEIYMAASPDIYRNTILAVSGHEGSGKTYLLNQVAQSLSRADAEILRIGFSDKEAENACSICRILLFINFGFLYDLSEEAFRTLISNNTNISSDIFMQLRAGASDQITALNIIDMINDMLSTTEVALFPDQSPLLHRNTSYIVVDDVQKVTKRHKKICLKIIEEFITRNYAQIMIVGYRPKEFRVSALEATLAKVCSVFWELLGISSADTYDSLKHCFNKDIAEFSKLFPSPISVLHLVLLIKKIKQRNILRNPHERRVVIYDNAYRETNVNDTSLAISKINHYRYKDILYIIYKIESGVPIQLLQEFFGDRYRKASGTFSIDLLFREENDSLKPYHDIYLNAFAQMHFSQKYMDILNDFLQYCIKQEVDLPILKSNILSILINRNNPLRTHYLASAREICQDYYSKSQYIAAQNLALALLPDMEQTSYFSYQYSDLELLYIFAQSFKYSRTHTESSKYLKRICDIGSVLSLDTKEMGIVYEAHSELITNYLYSLDFHDVEKELLYFEQNIKDVDRDSSEHKINAHLNYMNRNMIYIYFSGKGIVFDAFKNALDESIQLDRDDYEAYAKMDYAKIIFCENYNCALNLLEEALAVFKKYPKCEKRKVDCLFEIALINHLEKGCPYDSMYALQRRAWQNSFAHVYARITIALLTIELLNGADPKSIELRLDKLVVEYPDLQDTNRLTFFVNQLCAAIHNQLGDYNKQCGYLKRQMSNKNAFPASYVAIVEHNLNVNTGAAMQWKLGDTLSDQTVFLFDPRIW